MNFRVLILNFSLCLLLAGCSLSSVIGSLSSSSSDNSTTPTIPVVATPELSIDNIGSLTALPSTFNYQLMKLTPKDKDPTFVQWMPNAAGTKGPVVILFMPYEGINWTGLAVDNAWATQGNGLFPDANGPYYNASTSSVISYAAYAPAAIDDEAFVYLYNGISVLAVYGRFYAGTDLQSEVQDILTSLQFLKTQNIVDTTKIGIYSGSWGGLPSLYAMAQAPADVKPAVASFLYPLSDAQKINDYISTFIPAQTSDATALAGFNAFFDPYNRRINKATESLASDPDRYQNYRQSKLAGLTTSMFIAHDTWDTLVPQTMSQDLVSVLANSDNRQYYHLHTSALNYTTAERNHSQSANEPMTRADILPWAQLYLLNRLLPSTQVKYMIYSQTATLAQFSRTRALKLAGQDTSFYNSLLLELCNGTVGMIDPSVGTPVAGVNVLAYMFWNLIAAPESNATWNTVDATNVCNMISTTSPAAF